MLGAILRVEKFGDIHGYAPRFVKRSLYARPSFVVVRDSQRSMLSTQQFRIRKAGLPGGRKHKAGPQRNFRFLRQPGFLRWCGRDPRLSAHASGRVWLFGNASYKCIATSLFFLLPKVRCQQSGITGDIALAAMTPEGPRFEHPPSRVAFMESGIRLRKKRTPPSV